VTGTPETPSKVGISIADTAAGMYAFTGILTALYQRERTGKGTVLDISMFEALGEWMGYAAYFAAYGGTPPPRTGASHATIAPYGPFPTGDGRTIFLGIQNEREWARFCAAVLELPELASDERFSSNSGRVARREELEKIIGDTFSRLTAEQVLERLERAQIASANLNGPLDLWEHPQLAARGRWREVGSSVGGLRALLPPISLEGVEPRMDVIPRVGEHTEAILGEVGYDPEEIARLREEGAI
jgi:itaconate CoA-transferase